MTLRTKERHEMRWTRQIWMRLATINALISTLALMLSAYAPEPVSSIVRIGAQVQFMHSMASIACATFMNVGAQGARHAPAFLLSGSRLFALLDYGQAVGFLGSQLAATCFAMILMASGWIIMFAAGRAIDK
jgi:uncharacterized membrane protein YgdD (TMEM256/DUF423 family)